MSTSDESAQKTALETFSAPVEAFERTLGRQTPIKKCCCCSTYCGVTWTAVLVCIEALWHFGMSIARPAWEWNESAEQIASFVIANLVSPFQQCIQPQHCFVF